MGRKARISNLRLLNYHIIELSIEMPTSDSLKIYHPDNSKIRLSGKTKQ